MASKGDLRAKLQAHLAIKMLSDGLCSCLGDQQACVDIHKQAPKWDTMEGHHGQPEGKAQHGDKLASCHEQKVGACRPLGKQQSCLELLPKLDQVQEVVEENACDHLQRIELVCVLQARPASHVVTHQQLMIAS